MLKVILVDDEYLVVESIRNAVQWNNLGFEIAGQAGDGEEGLKLVEELCPDLAIVDINMPFIDGLEFARIAHERFPELRVLILTGYSSFDYAREAIKSGVSGYLLKPVDSAELASVLAEQKAAIEAAQSRKYRFEKLESLTRESEAQRGERFLLESVLEAPAGPDDSIAQRLAELYPDFRCPSAAVAVIDAVGEGRPAALQAFGDVFRTVPHQLVPGRGGRIVLVADEAEGNGMQRLMQEAVRKVTAGGAFTVTAGMGSPQEFPGGVACSYREALLALRHRVLLGQNRVIPFDGAFMKGKSSLNFESLRQNLLICLRLGGREEALRLLEGAFASAARDHAPLDALHRLLSELLLAAGSFAGECGMGNLPAPYEAVTADGLIDESESLEDIRTATAGLFATLLQGVAEKKTGPRAAVEKAKAYVDANLKDPELDLEGIARSTFINASYLSSIFKKETGVSLTDYVKAERMAKARDLMGRGYGNVEDVAGRVGFTDANYFRKCFKKAYGVSPSEYISRLMR